MRRLFSIDGPLPPILVPLIGAIIALAVARSPAQAQDKLVDGPAAKTTTYVLGDSDGYGIADCFKQGSSCGRIVAASWCEGHGHGAAAAWGSADDMTASIPAGAKATPKGALVITCNN